MCGCWSGVGSLLREVCYHASGHVQPTHGDRVTSQAVRIAGDIALRWNEGTLPQPPPLSTFAHVMPPAVAPGWTTAPPQPARSESSEWERRYRQAEIAQQDAAYEASVARVRCTVQGPWLPPSWRRSLLGSAACRWLWTGSRSSGSAARRRTN